MNREKHEKAAKKYAEVIKSHTNRRQRGDVVESHSGVSQVAEVDDNEEVSGDESPGAKGSDGRGSNANQKTKGDEASKSGLDLNESINSDMSEIDIHKKEENVFQALLGLPEISIETLYQAAKEKDKTILNLMNEHTNFI